MLFNSTAFIILLLITFFAYYIPKLYKYQVPILIISSLFFYGYYKPILVLLLVFSAVINTFTSYYIVYGKIKKKKTLAVFGVFLNLLILAFFKYSPLFSRTFFFETSSIGEFLITIPLPIGISFFTFQGISLVLDVYSQKYFKNEDVISPSLLNHAKRTLFFISFFPQLIAGPIVKAHDFLYQIGTKKIKEINWENAFRNLILGYFLKMVVADNLKDYTFWISFPYFQGLSSITLFMMLFGYSFQIFADFAGYSLIAIGLASLFGYNLKMNFNFPYISKSFKEFWKRWHISLSSFLMEYLYFPLGGNRKGHARTYINLMITMILGGLWHGAAWSYAVWGAFHGLALALERLISDTFKIRKNYLIVDFFKIIIVFLFVTLAWLLFKLPSFEHVIEYFKCFYNNFYLWDDTRIITFIFLYSSPVIFYHLIYLMKDFKIYSLIKKLEPVFYGIMLFLIILNSGSSGAFIYFQF